MSKQTKLDYNDLLIMPAEASNVRSRKEVYPFYNHINGFHLPLITAPMDTVANDKNSECFLNLGINVCYPRHENPKFKKKSGVMEFESISLTEFEDMISKEKINPNSVDGKYYVCVDVANGHMKFLHDLVRSAKEKFGDSIVIMTGNIANPETYRILSECGADFIRCGIGVGGACITTVQTGVGFPQASLISECYKISTSINNPAKIVADGGINSYSDILKCLALGADYVMAGSIFNKALESCGDTYFYTFKIDPIGKFASYLFDKGFVLNKKFRGMSTKEVQKKWGKEELTTSEGVTRVRKVEYKLEKWIENFTDYLRSNMSYCNVKQLSDYIGAPQMVEISDKAYKRFDK